MNENKVSSLLSDAKEFFNDKEFGKCLECCYSILEIEPNNNEANKYRKNIFSIFENKLYNYVDLCLFQVFYEISEYMPNNLELYKHIGSVDLFFMRLKIGYRSLTKYNINKNIDEVIFIKSNDNKRKIFLEASKIIRNNIKNAKIESKNFLETLKDDIKYNILSGHENYNDLLPNLFHLVKGTEPVNSEEYSFSNDERKDIVIKILNDMEKKKIFEIE